MEKSADVSKLETLRCNKCGMEPSYATTILDPPTMSAREVGEINADVRFEEFRYLVVVADYAVLAAHAVEVAVPSPQRRCL